MNKKIKKLVEQQEICSIYNNPEDTNKFAVGYFIKCDEEYAIVESINPYGQSDGIFWLPIENIIKIETKNKYTCCIKKLFDYYKQTRHYTWQFSENLLLDMLNYIKNNAKICTMELCDSIKDDVQGFIVDISNEVIKMKIIDSYGYEDGEVFVNGNNISCLACDSSEEKKIEVLFNLNKTKL